MAIGRWLLCSEAITFQGQRYRLIVSHAATNCNRSLQDRRSSTCSGAGMSLDMAMTPSVSTAIRFKRAVCRP